MARKKHFRNYYKDLIYKILPLVTFEVSSLFPSTTKSHNLIIKSPNGVNKVYLESLKSILSIHINIVAIAAAACVVC